MKDNVVVPPETSDLGNKILSNPDDPPCENFSHDGNQLSALTQSRLDVDATNDLEVSTGNLEGVSETSPANCRSALAPPCTEGVLDLLRQAVESGRAVILDSSSLDADVVYERSVAVAQAAPPGPVFKHLPPKAAIQKSENKNPVQKRESKNPGDLEAAEALPVAGPVMAVNKSNEKKLNGRKSFRIHKGNDVKRELQLSDVVPQGSLELDELAKLLA